MRRNSEGIVDAAEFLPVKIRLSVEISHSIQSSGWADNLIEAPTLFELS